MDLEGAPSTSTADWVLETAKNYYKLLTDPSTWDDAISHAIDHEAARLTAAAMSTADMTTWALEQAFKLLNTSMPVYGAVVGIILNKLMGISVSEAQVKAYFDGSISAADKNAIGSALGKVILDTFDLAGVKAGYAKREPGTAEVNSFNAFLGTSFQLRLGSNLLKQTTSFVPPAFLKGVEDLGDDIEKMLGLSDAFEEMLEPLMESLTIEGWRKAFNREIRPKDYSYTEATQALLSGKIERALYDKVLDNEGFRDDIRDTLLDMAEPNLPESDVQALYDLRQMSDEEVTAHYRDKNYRAPNANRQAHLVATNRKRKIQEEARKILQDLYIRGKAEEAEYRDYLTRLGYTNEEIALELNRCGLEARLRAKDEEVEEGPHLSEADVQDLFDHCLWGEADVLQYYLDKGFSPDRAGLKRDLIVSQKVWNAQKKVTDLMLSLYADGVKTEEQLILWLRTTGCSAAEVALMVEMSRLSREKRSFLSPPDMLKAMAIGLYSPALAVETLMQRGYSRGDAVAYVLTRMAAEFPAECFPVVTAQDRIDSLRELLPMLQDDNIPFNDRMRRFIECLRPVTPTEGA